MAPLLARHRATSQQPAILLLEIRGEISQRSLRPAPVSLHRQPMRVHHADRFLPPTPGTAAICVIHSASWRSSRSFTGSSCTPRVDLPIPTGVAGGTGVSDAPFTNMSLTWPAKPPQQKHQPSPTPSYDGPTSRSAAGREASCPRGHRHVRRCRAAAAAGSRCTQDRLGFLHQFRVRFHLTRMGVTPAAVRASQAVQVHRRV